MTTHVVAISGGKDSTAMALRLAEIEPNEYTYICNPTGDELPDMLSHWSKLESLLGKPLLRVTNRTLSEWITEYAALPNWRQRWCTRLLKIEPTIAWLAKQNDPLLHVGLRADEEEREGIVSRDVRCRFPLREWGWGLPEVLGYLVERGISIPRRTDCARCYGQRLSEWWRLWRRYPALYANAEDDEARTGKTFRSQGRDTQPAALRDLRIKFEAGYRPRGADDDDGATACRICTL